MKPRYTARAERSGAWWAVDVFELRGVFTQARRLGHVEAMAREAISLMLEIPADSFDIQVVAKLEPDLGDLVAAATDARRRATDADREAADATRGAVAALLATGLTMRDAGILLGVSHQRIAQLAPRAHADVAPVSAPTLGRGRVAASGPG